MTEPPAEDSERDDATPARRPYVPPSVEVLGTIASMTKMSSRKGRAFIDNGSGLSK